MKGILVTWFMGSQFLVKGHAFTLFRLFSPFLSPTKFEEVHFSQRFLKPGYMKVAHKYLR